MGIDFEIRKKYRDFSLDLSLKCDSKRIGILGASGCGKTMTLKALAGLVRPDEGHVTVDGRVLFNSGASVDIPARKRNIGYLFQNYALFPNMTVEENIRAALHG
ncbi:MAG: ATP-binding cassette domain-containing protein, partial [Lachnospiraceae bacterium]|nr:ATP-binding cassette domain-containing protein [Lachnospiraceae bacterium]